jgi:hypothetical protein
MKIAELIDLAQKIRNSKLIEEELADLRAIMEKEKELISQHPEHEELQLIHADSLNREQELIKELTESMKRPTIIYKLIYESASIHNASAQILGRVLTNMQSLVFAIAGSSLIGGRRSKRDEYLYLLNVDFKQGSVAMEFSPASLAPTLEDIMLQAPVFDKASEFLDILPKRVYDDKEIKLEVNKQISDPRARIATLNSLKGLIPPPGKEAIIEFRNINRSSSAVKLHDDVLKRRVDQLLKDEIEKNDIEVLGVIVGIRIDMPDPYFLVKDWNGKLIKVQLPDDKSNEIFDYIHNRIPIKLSGAGNRRKLMEIAELDKIIPNDKILIKSSHNRKLESPLEAQLSFENYDDKDYWVVGNDEFGAYGVDSNVKKAKEMFEEDLHDKYTFFKALDDSQLTEKAKDLKNRLIYLFEG